MADLSHRTEPRRTGDAIISEGNGSISRERVTIESGQNLGANAVLGQITGNSQWTAVDPGAADGSEVARGMLIKAVDASAAAGSGVIIRRLAELANEDLDWGTLNAGQITTARGQLESENIIVRDAI